MTTIPFLVNFSFITLLVIMLIALLLVFRKTIVASKAKRRYVAPLLLFALWVVLSILSHQGVFLDTIKEMPSAFIPAVLATNLFGVYFALLYKPLQEFADTKMKYAIALQTFRLPLELIFVWLFSLNLLPIQMTFEGRNPDILMGLTAPFIAYFGYHKKVLPLWLVIGWNLAGLVLLFNIVTVAILSAPTNFQVFTNLPHNTVVLQSPYHLVPFFLVPLALFGHLFALKRLLTRCSV